MNNSSKSSEFDLITYRGMVYPWHCDHTGHMNVMWYVGKFDEATWHLFASMGITPTYIRDNERGMVAVEQRISYKRELLAGDVITIRSGILEMKERVIRFCHEMRNEETGEIATRRWQVRPLSATPRSLGALTKRASRHKIGKDGK